MRCCMRVVYNFRQGESVKQAAAMADALHTDLHSALFVFAFSRFQRIVTQYTNITAVRRHFIFKQLFDRHPDQ